MKIIGLTGNIGSGKSLAAAILEQLGAGRIDADRVGHGVIAPGGPAYAGLLEAFGAGFLREDGSFDRPRLGAYVFGDLSGERTRLLNSLTHPYIFAEIRQRIERFRAARYAMIVIEAALLFDIGLCRITNENWVIAAPRELLLARAAERDHSTPELIAARLEAQKPQEDLIRLADRVIVNDGDTEQLRRRLAVAYREISGS